MIITHQNGYFIMILIFHHNDFFLQIFILYHLIIFLVQSIELTIKKNIFSNKIFKLNHIQISWRQI